MRPHERAKALARMQAQVDAWNAAHPVGTRVRYWRGAREGAPSGEGETWHPATVLSGHTPVAWIQGAGGCIALTHVEVVPSAEASDAG